MAQNNTPEYKQRKQEYRESVRWNYADWNNRMFFKPASRFVKDPIIDFLKNAKRNLKNTFFPKTLPALPDYMNLYTLSRDSAKDSELKNFFLKYKWGKVISIDVFRNDFFENNDFTKPKEEFIKETIKYNENENQLLIDTQAIFTILNEGTMHPLFLGSPC